MEYGDWKAGQRMTLRCIRVEEFEGRVLFITGSYIIFVESCMFFVVRSFLKREEESTILNNCQY